MLNISSETISHQVFRSRIQYLQMHLQTVDAALYVMKRSISVQSNKKGNLAKVLGFEIDRYSELKQPAKEKNRIINHTRARNSEYAVITLYGYFTEYLKNILGELYKHDPLLVVGKAPEEYRLSYVEIVKLRNFEAISELMIEKVFRSLEDERSTTKLLDKILDKTVKIDKTLKTKALKYLDMRHLFIHASGKVDQIFAQKYGEDLAIKAGNKLPTTYENAQAAIEAVGLLCKKIDQELIANKFVTPRPEPPNKKQVGGLPIAVIEAR